jgi:hypothetical protein
LSEPLFGHVRWVAQEDDAGCGAATLAMLTGRTYREARDLIDSLWPNVKDWTADGNGSNEFDLDRCLYADGFFIQRRYSSWRDNGTSAILPFPDPFAPAHYCMVRQPSNSYHFVVMLADGRVLDPMREGYFALAEWPEVAQVVGVSRPLTLVLAEVATAARRFVRAEGEGVSSLIEDSHFQLLRAVTNLAEARRAA